MNTYQELIRYLREEVGHGADSPLPVMSVIKKLLAKEKGHYLFWFRIAQYLYRKPRGLIHYRKLAKRINKSLIRLHNIDIGLGAEIGPGLHFVHRIGIVITDRCVIGCNLRVRQNTTIGVKDPASHAKIYIGDRVDLGAHTCIVGNNLRIGNDVVIGAMSLVNKHIPDNSIFYSTHLPNIKPRIENVDAGLASS